MPIYEYRCKKNGHQFEVIQKFSDPPLKKCRFCDSKVEKLISLSSFVLKGSGFYVNDYARKNGSQDTKAKEPSKPSSSSSDTSKSDKTSKKGEGGGKPATAA